MIITRFRPAIARLPAVGRHVGSACTKRCMASGPPSPTPVAASKVPILGSITNELDKIAPRFEVEADRIQIIRGPADFYSGLKVYQVKNLDAGLRSLQHRNEY
jgi:hypothetical protein